MTRGDPAASLPRGARVRAARGAAASAAMAAPRTRRRGAAGTAGMARDGMVTAPNGLAARLPVARAQRARRRAVRANALR